MVKRPGGVRMPGWRDFERSIAEVLNGDAGEDKGIFDVHVPADGPRPYGLSCKMAAFQPPKHNSVLMEVANALAQFRTALHQQDINWVTEPNMAGPALINHVVGWHRAVIDYVDVERSSYLALAHDAKYKAWRLSWFDLNLKYIDPVSEIDWHHEGKSLRGVEKTTGRTLWQCYLTSGGQLKYYPSLDWARWTSETFELEEPSERETLIERAKRYFGHQWPD